MDRKTKIVATKVQQVETIIIPEEMIVDEEEFKNLQEIIVPHDTDGRGSPRENNEESIVFKKKDTGKEGPTKDITAKHESDKEDLNASGPINPDDLKLEEKPEGQKKILNKIEEKVGEKKLSGLLKHKNNSSSYIEDSTGLKDSKKDEERILTMEFKWPKKTRIKFIIFTMFLFFHIILTHLIKPVCTIFQMVFLTVIVNVKTDQDEETDSDVVYMSSGVIVIGWAIMFILPLISFFQRGLRIVALKDTFLSKVFMGIYILIECILNFPLTFFYEHPSHSIYLFNEQGMEKLLSPTLIFFPTIYTMSLVEIIRNFLEPIFFFAIGIIKWRQIRDNFLSGFFVILLEIMLAICVCRLIANILVLIGKLKLMEKLTKKIKT
jgi:hypothetical protein